MRHTALLLGLLLLSARSATAQSGDGNAFFRWQADKPAVYAGQAVRVQLKLYYTGSVSPPDVVPRLSVPDAWTREIRRKSVPGQETIGGHTYGVAVLKTYLVIPQKPGVLRLPALPLTLRVTLPPKPDDFFQVEQTVSQKLTVPGQTLPVKPLPAPRPPAAAVGTFSWRITASPDSVGVRQPVSVRYEVGGTGNLPFVSLPAVAFPSGLEGFESNATDDFTVTETGVSGRRVFVQPLVAERAGRYALPLSFVYFDPERAVYVTLTDTLRLVATDTARQAAASPPAREGAGFPAWHPGPPTAALPWTGAAWYWLACLLPLAGTAGVWAWARWRRFRAGSLRQPYRAARAMLHSIRMRPGLLPQEAGRTLERVLQAYLAGRHAISGADLYASRLRDILQARHIPEPAAEALLTLLAECQALRFAVPPPDADVPKLVQQADTVLRHLEFPGIVPDVPRAARAVAGVAGLLAAGLAAIASSENPYARAENLYKRQQFDSAAGVLRVLAAREDAGGAVHANLAGCYFQTGRPGPAVWHLEKAVRLAPGDARMQAALKAVYNHIGVPPPVARPWRPWTAMTQENRWACLALAAWWLGGLLLSGVILLARKAWVWPGRLAWMAAAGLWLGVVWMARSRQMDAAAVVLAPASGRYAPAWQAREMARLPAGTSVTVEDQFNGWQKVRLPDGRRVWVEAPALKRLGGQ